MAQAYGMHGEGPITDPERSGSGAQARHRDREEGRAGHDRRGDATRGERSCASAHLLLAHRGSLASAQSPTGDAKHGKELFLSYACYSCHSFDGHGGAGARLVPMPLNQTAFIAFVRNAGRMPSYSSKVLPDEQAGRHLRLHQDASRFAGRQEHPADPRIAERTLRIRILTRRGLLRSVAGGTVAVAVGLDNVVGQPPPGPPNIVFIMADDLGYADVSCYGRPDISTPNIDGLAAKGVRFLQAYANSAVCSATRTALITGRYQYRLPIGLEEPLTGRDVGLPPDHPTLPSLLKKAGYGTTLVGKWHLGLLPKFGPLQSGYDHFYGFRGGAVDYYTHASQKTICGTTTCRCTRWAT